MRVTFHIILVIIPFIILALATGHLEVGGMWPYMLGLLCYAAMYFTARTA